MTSILKVDNIKDSADNQAISISGGVVTFTSDPFNSVIETLYYDSQARVHTNTTDLNQAWTRITTNNTANKNGGMSASSGIWTFPSTGVWLISLQLIWTSSASSIYEGADLLVTSDNSSYTAIHSILNHSNASGQYSSLSMPYYLNITDTTNQKFKWQVRVVNQITIRGGSADPYSTKAQFIKLCPSV